MAQITVYTDGGARGNPGPAALGVYITNDKNQVLAKIGKYLGETTNNIAEYLAIDEAFNWLLENKEIQQIKEVRFYMDSQLAYSQLTGLYKVKNEKIREIIFRIRNKEAQLSTPIFYSHVPREKNKNADYLVNLALDNTIKNI